MPDLKTCFKRVDYDLSGLLHYIDIGDIGLPDIQRPFVWPNTKVRDLFDSMYRGFPVGYLLFWENGEGNGAKQIGVGQKAHITASRLIIDGQQRLTALYSVFRGKKILDSNFKERQVEIAFRPRDGKFEVADAAIRRDPEWIPNISTLWSSGKSSYLLVKDFLKSLGAKQQLSEEEEENISLNLDRLFDLQKYPFTALEISPSVDEEQVADIFVRINSEGVTLNQADFILTLLSVFWDEGRHELEKFCRSCRFPPAPGFASPYNHFIQPDPDQLLRVSVALGFERGRLKSVYQILRGKNMESGDYSIEEREAQFARLKQAQAKVLDLTQWHQFLSALVGAGFRGNEMVSSKNALLYSYALYLLGRERAVSPHVLQKLIGRWFFFATLTNRYTRNAPETIMDADLNRLKEKFGADGFVQVLSGILASELTSDYWSITLPSDLESSAARSPQLLAYIAAQNRLGALALFSHKKISELLDPALTPKKKPLDQHHLFPQGYLKSIGIGDPRQINQVANFALLEWPDNMDISDSAPSVYYPTVRPHVTDDKEWTEMRTLHALPDGWHSMEYGDFLLQRRKLMAGVIRRGFEALS